LRYLIGLGTWTASDDAVGLRVVEHIAAAGLERGFKALALPAGSLDLVAYLRPDTEAILVVDAARMGLAPGEFKVFGPADVEGPAPGAGFSTHEDNLQQVLALARTLDYPIPPLAILGVEPASVTPGLALSPAIAERLPAYAAVAIDRLRAL
jgi:hydrogenase maturation protease